MKTINKVPIAVPIGELITGRLTSVKFENPSSEYIHPKRYIPSMLQTMAIDLGLSEKDQAIIYCVIQLRCMSTQQIYRLLYKHYGLTNRACRKKLQYLTDHKLLTKLNRRIGGYAKGSAQAVYAPGPFTCRYIKVRHYFFKTAMGGHLINHSLAVAEVYVSIFEAAFNGKFKILTLQAEPDCWRQFALFSGAHINLKPDLYVKVKGLIEFSWFIEVDRSTTSAIKIFDKAKLYEKYLLVGIEQYKNGIFPKVLWITPDKNRSDNILKMVAGIDQDIPWLCDSVPITDFIPKLTEINLDQYK